MVDSISNDNNFPRADGHGPAPDPHGQAAILLLESLIHGLIARSIITVADAVEIVDVAADIGAEIASEPGNSAATSEKSLSLLGAIRASLAHDLPHSEARPPAPLS